MLADGTCGFMAALPSGYLTQLELERHGSAYLKRLSYGLAQFQLWVMTTGVSLVLHRRHRQLIDGLLAQFVQFCFSQQRSLALPKHAVLAVQKLLNLRFALPRAWTALRSWALRAPPRHRTPLPFELLQVFFVMALEAHLRSEGMGLMLPLAVLLRVCFFGLLRPGGIYKLRRGDVRLGVTSDGKPVATVILRAPKNRASMGVNQFVILQEPGTVLWLGWLIHELPLNAYLWPSSGLRFRQLFASLADLCGLQHSRLSPGGLRAGGATWLFTETANIGHLQFTGRWRSPQSLHSYIQEAMSCLVWLERPASTRLLCQAAISVLRTLWDFPPARPCHLFGPRPRGWRPRRRPSPEPCSEARRSSTPLAT